MLLLTFLAGTLLFSAAVLFITYKVTHLQEFVLREAENRVGLQLTIGKVSVFGFRGISIQDVKASVQNPTGPTLNIEAPEVIVYVDLGDLLYGKVTIDRFQLNNANIAVRRPPQSAWFSAEAFRNLLPPDGAPEHRLSFRVLGQNCHLTLHNVVADSMLYVSDAGFDISRLPESEDTSIRVNGLINGAPEKKLQASLRYRSVDDFFLNLQCGQISAAEVNVFLPASQHLMQSGFFTPSVQVSGQQGGRLLMDVQAPFENAVLRGQPDFLQPDSGRVTAMAEYILAEHRLSLTTARAETKQFTGRVEGQVLFANEPPELDLHLYAHQLPIKDMIQSTLSEKTAAYGAVTLGLLEPYEIRLHLKGTPEHPTITAEGNVAGGAVQFLPKDEKTFPKANVQLSALQTSWEPGAPFPLCSVSLVGGEIDYAPWDLKADNLTGALSIQKDTLVLDPFHTVVRNFPWSGKARYILPEKRYEFSVTGILNEMEKSPFSKVGKDLSLSGASNMQVSGTWSAGAKELRFNGDATNAAIRYQWWLKKPVGVGSTLKDISVAIIPGESLKIAGQMTIDTTTLNTQFLFVPGKEGWRAQQYRIDVPSLDANSAGKCLVVPYTITGGTGTEGYITLERPTPDAPGHILKIGAQLSDVALLAKDAKTALQVKGAKVETVVDATNPDAVKADLTISAEEANVPPSGEKWLLPIKPQDAEMLALYPDKPLAWTYHLASKKIAWLPWEGTDFTGVAYNEGDETGLKSFAATVGQGHVEGSYQHKKNENIDSLEARWTNIPASYILRHMKWPELLSGLINGDIAYQVDRDDTNSTLKGKGSFEIKDGQFSADYFLTQFKKQLADELTAMPPSLQFTRLAATIELEGDIIRTPSLELESKGIRISGKGQFVFDGDMDYTIKLSISPETAQLMPVLNEKLLVEGHKLTQNNIEFELKLQGPTFRPSSTVLSLPSMELTLVSGAAEVTGEVIKVIGTPHRILIDVLKTFGGIVGSGGGQKSK